MYKKITIEDVEHILLITKIGSMISFPNIESNDGPERQAYLAWVAEGNEAEEWSAE